ncbi:M56 family metallopeptidase [Microbulbifer sp. SAOS-129_SWC]|uniref:M56 family metallopeptidase n=1 Tax=Microbulbifer sp. SAOS-129_SWC TaxID=3145235 RepID=UPI003217AD09
MILGQPALWLNLLTIAALCLLVGILLVAGICAAISHSAKFFRSSVRLSANARRPLLWSAVLLPWLAASAAAVILVFPEALGGPAASLAHWHHIHAFNLYSWHGISTLGFLSLSALLLVRSCRRAYRHVSQLRLLLQVCEREAGDVSIIRSPRAQAFTSGLLRPRGFYTSGLRDGISSEEFAVVRLHEEAHARRYDPLKKLLFALFAGFFPQGSRNYLNRQMMLCMEQCADEQVYRQGWSDTFIAQTLLKVTRLSNGMYAGNTGSPICCHFALDQLDARVHYLLADDKGRSLPRLLIGIPFLLLTGSCLVSVDALHHFIETLFSH